MQSSHGFVPVFDDPNLVSAAGLAPVLSLADRAGLTDALTRLTVKSPNAAVKARAVIAGMLAGADSIDDLNLLRSGGTGRLIGEVRAPSTLGTFLRSFTHGHVLQLAKTNREVLTGGPSPFTGREGLVFLDVDDTIREVHGYQKQAAAFGYSKVRGLNALVTMISTDGVAPIIADAQLRRGNVKSGDHADWHLTRTLATAGKLAPGRQVLVRADSAFCTYKNVTAVQKKGAWFSITIPHWKTVTAAISAIPDQAWTTIKYPEAIWDDESGAWISDAEVAETPFTAFTSRKKDQHVACRLVVRRVKRLGKPSDPEALFDVFRYHAFVTNSDPAVLGTIDADQRHRAHAIVEQVISELKQGPLAHLPSGKFTANQAWLGFAVIAYNLAHAAARTAGMTTARMQTLLRKIIQVPARLAKHARKLIIHLPQAWPWQTEWMTLWNAAHST